MPGRQNVIGPLYKALRDDLSSFRENEGSWPAPDRCGPGAWKRATDGPSGPGATGLELHRLGDLPGALGARLFLAEADEIVAVTDHGVVAGRARLLQPVDAWDERAARHFAADCVEKVLGELDWPLVDDDRPRQAILVARAFAEGRVSTDTMHRTWAGVHALARVHTCDVPCVESWQAAWDAFDALLESDAGDAARIAARASRESAVLSAAWWAGWTAAMDAAWTACTAARIEELREAASLMARDQARETVRASQARRLDQYLHGCVNRGAAAPVQQMHRG